MIDKGLRDFMMKIWNKRCKEYKKGCVNCEAWKCYDFLTLSDNLVWDNRLLKWKVDKKKWGK